MSHPILFDHGTGAAPEARDSLDFFEVGFTRTRSQRVRKFSLGDGYEQVTPDGPNNLVNTYNLRTRPLTDAEARDLDEDFADLEGDFFYAKFAQDDERYKYRLEPNEWSWEIVTTERRNRTRRNVISFQVKQIYDWRL